jgi:long-chain acyl-CoA synthetase
MLRNGWLHTADIATMDHDGFVTIIDRKRDVILASGFSIFPSEIEDVLAQHPAVESCAIAGVSHYYRGETVKAFVALKPQAKGRVTGAQITEWARQHLAAYKVPRLIRFAAEEELPLTTTGKVQKNRLASTFFTSGRAS